MRCANPKCGRPVVKNPVVVSVAGVTLVFGSTCAKRAGLIPPKPRTRRYAVATPRAMPDPAPEVLPGSVPLWTDDEEGIDDDDGTD